MFSSGFFLCKDSTPFRVALVLGVTLVLTACGGDKSATPGKRVIVLGIDGMDPDFTQMMMDKGEMPNLAKLAASGGFQPLGTSAPPLSPVAWSNFITGTDSGGHGIFDFLHRDPTAKMLIPKLSTSDALPPDRVWKLGDYQFASGGGHVLNRKGQAFWEPLEKKGVTTHILRMPANFPVTGTATHELSGMGTPDVMGTYGIFHFYTSKLFAFAGQDIGGGEVHEIWPEDGVLVDVIPGPPNPFKAEEEDLEAEFTAYLDPHEERVKFVVGDEEFVLESGEWSGWIPIEYEMIPSQTLGGVVRFYLRSVRPEIEFYITPVNYDPVAPGAPISHPPEYAADIAELYGDRYYTQGMPEDTQALREEVLTRDEFLQQAELVGQEHLAQYEVLLEDFQKTSGDGLFFYYLGNIDLVSHMMWHTLDPEHPKYDVERDPAYADVIPRLYRKADEMIGSTLEKMSDDTTLIVMSDHGFSSWRRAFNLNSWLAREGYLALKNGYMGDDDPGFYLNVDWSKTRAYNLGIGGGIYVNMKDREANGIVEPAERDALLKEIGDKLLAEIDPETGLPAVTRVYYRDEFFSDQGSREIGPDMMAGYAKGTRNSDASSTGEIPEEVITDNMSNWTGDHGMDHTSVPGVLAYSRPLKKKATNLSDLATSILAEFGIEDFPEGQTAYRSETAAGDDLAQR